VNPVDDLLFEVPTPVGFTVRCTRAYWRFIIEHEHPVPSRPGRV
jgi:hypothetical protein